MTPDEQPAPEAEVPAAPPAPAPLPLDDPSFDKEHGITRPSPGVRIFDIENTQGKNPP